MLNSNSHLQAVATSLGNAFPEEIMRKNFNDLEFGKDSLNTTQSA